MLTYAFCMGKVIKHKILMIFLKDSKWNFETLKHIGRLKYSNMRKRFHSKWHCFHLSLTWVINYKRFEHYANHAT